LIRLLLPLLALFPTSAMAMDCQTMLAKVAALPAIGSTELMATSGKSFKSLFDECDRRNTFNGAATPRKCTTDPNRVDFLRKYADGTIAFRAKMSVDADGSPVSMGPGASTTDQPETWLTFDAGSDRHFVNAEVTAFAVVPIKAPSGISFLRATGIGKGDLVAIMRRDRCSFGVVGDAGPFFRIGEASIRSHEDLGNSQCAVAGQKPCRRLKGGGSGVGLASGVTYLIFPGTRPRPLLNQSVNDVAGAAASAKAANFLELFSP
jgi:Fungal chitosanase of glycosyl hydrolase group 75